MEVDREESLLSSSPFWQQQHNSDHLRHRRLNRTSSLVFNSGAVLLVLIVAALAFVFVIAPAIASFASQVFRPHSVKKSWDSLNLFLVIFAVVCGLLSRNSGGGGGGGAGEHLETPKWNASTPSRYQWSEDSSDRSATVFRRMRSSSSYPDLRQESSWMVDERWRFHDDTEVSQYHRSPDSDHPLLRHRHRSWRNREEEEEERKEVKPEEKLEMKNIEVDTFEVRRKEDSSKRKKSESPPQPRSSSPPPPPPPPKEVVVKRKPKRSHRAIEKRKDEAEQPPPPSRAPPPPPPPPPPPFSEYQELDQIGEKSEKKRGKEFLISLRRKKKKQRQKSVENFDAIITSAIDPPSSQHFFPPPSPPPPPPPLPPPPSAFLTLFSKKTKTRKALPSPKSEPPPPPPPPPTTRLSRNRVQSRPVRTTQKPPSPAEFNVETIGNESPLIPIPPPPPPPPFKVKEWKFPRRGEFVRVMSNNSSRSTSPELYGGDESPAENPMAAAVAEISPEMSPARIFCPSPDVDTKADNFIARFRAGLKLEKDNSFKERDGVGVGGSGKSRLGLKMGPGMN